MKLLIEVVGLGIIGYKKIMKGIKKILMMRIKKEEVMKKLLFVISLCIIFCGCAITQKCPTMSDFLQKLETVDRGRPDDTMRIKVFSFPLPNNIMGYPEELEPYGELIEKWINESDECGVIIAIGLAIDGIREGEDFRRLVFSVFYEPKEEPEDVIEPEDGGSVIEKYFRLDKNPA